MIRLSSSPHEEMPTPDHPSSNRASARLRLLEKLVLVLIVSNFGLGVFSLYLLNKIDGQYSKLIDESVSQLSAMQTLTARSIEAFRASGRSLLEAPAGARNQAILEGRRTAERDRALRRKILDQSWPANEQARLEFQEAGERFSAATAEILRLADSGQMAAASAWRETSVRPAYDRYLNAITAVADALEEETLQSNYDYTTKTGSHSAMVLSLAGWLVIILLGLLLATLVFVLMLLLLFRGSEIGDIP